MGGHTVKFLGAAKSHISRPNPEQMVRDAIDLAYELVSDAAKELSDIRLAGGGVNEDMAATKRAYYRSKGRAFPIFFGWNEANPNGMLRKIELRLSETLDRIDKGLTINCRPATGRRSRKCSEGVTAFQVGGWVLNPRTFNLCPKWFDDPDNDPNHARQHAVRRAAILVHELCHAIGGPGGRLDQKDISGNTVYGADRALAFAHNEPDDACFSAENVEQFLIYRDGLSDTGAFPVTGTSGWTGVPAHMDAAVEHPNGKFYFFKGAQYWRYDPDQNKVDKAEARIGTDGWSGLPSDIDAAIVHPRNGKIYVFKGDRYWRFDASAGVDKVDHDDVRKIGSSGWSGLKPGIQAAFVHPNGRTAQFFYGPNIAIFNFAQDKVVGWRFARDWGLKTVYGNLNAALYLPSNKKAYFFTAEHYQRHQM